MTIKEAAVEELTKQKRYEAVKLCASLLRLEEKQIAFLNQIYEALADLEKLDTTKARAIFDNRH